MENFTELQKEALDDLDVEVAFVSYDPSTVVGDPEADAIADGWTEHYREDTANLVEVIYTR